METKNRPVPTNVLVPSSHREALKQLSRATRICQSEFLREAIGDLLEKYDRTVAEAAPAAAFAARDSRALGHEAADA